MKQQIHGILGMYVKVWQQHSQYMKKTEKKEIIKQDFETLLWLRNWHFLLILAGGGGSLLPGITSTVHVICY